MQHRFVGLLLPLAGALSFQPAAHAQIPDCNRGIDLNCLYVPARTYTIREIDRSFDYTDATGRSRTVWATIRLPDGLNGRLPVVIWSHGGAGGRTGPADGLKEWGVVSAKAGYASVTLTHASREDDSRGALCNYLGLAGSAVPLTPPCSNLKYLNWDRPHDIRAVIDAIAAAAGTGTLLSQLDAAHIAVGGHSAGAGGTLMTGGAARIFRMAPVILEDARPVAFLAFSPQQAGLDGFYDTDFRRPETSWSNITRPVLVGTGDGDNTCNPDPEVAGDCIGDTPSGRRGVFERMRRGNKFLLFLHDADAFHTLFEDNYQACIDKGVPASKCLLFVRTLTAYGLAFLDAKVKNDPVAEVWLRANSVERASGGSVEWVVK